MPIHEDCQTIKKALGNAGQERLQQISHLFPLIEKYQPSFLVDFGCGDGELLKRFSSIPRRIGVDPYCKHEPSVNNEVYFTDSIDSIESESADLITFIDVLEHLNPADAEDALKNIHRILKPGGHILLQTNNPKSAIAHQTFWNDPTHVRMYAKEWLQEWLNIIGFKVLESGFNTYFMYKPLNPLIKILRLIRYPFWDPCELYWVVARKEG